jgi:predicted MPP superfamily phosphohydrolase
MNRRSFVKRSLAASAALGAVTGYARCLERHAVELVTVAVELGLPAPLRAAVLGDIHFDPLHETEYLEAVVASVNGLAPDLVLYTGDFLSRSAERFGELLAVLRTARAADGCFAVLGNHDHDVNADAVAAGLASAGVCVLRNRSVPLPGRAGWHLTGLESFWCGRPNTAALAQTPAGSRHVLLVHEPDSFDLLPDPRIALQVSGHTHGGQVRLPVVGAVCLPSWGKKYEAGLYARGGCTSTAASAPSMNTSASTAGRRSPFWS